MQYITINQAFEAVFRIPESQSSDTVAYQIFLASDGSVFASGTATYVNGENWKVDFTPTTVGEVYIVEITDSTLDTKDFDYFKAVVSTQQSAVVTETDSQSLLNALNAAILARMNGGAVQSYMIGGRNVMYMSLDQLMSMRDKLKREVGRSNGPATNYAQFKKPS